MSKLVGDEMIIGVSRPENSPDSGEPATMSTGDDANGDDSDGLVLQLADLVPDGAGEVALYAGKDLPVSLLSDAPLLDAGVADTHVTASGLDVSGHRLYRFANGITVYCPEALRITLL